MRQGERIKDVGMRPTKKRRSNTTLPIGSERRKKAGKREMKRYKVKRHGDGSFSVWELKNFGQGWAWIDTGKRYPKEKNSDLQFTDLHQKQGGVNDG